VLGRFVSAAGPAAGPDMYRLEVRWDDGDGEFSAPVRCGAGALGALARAVCSAEPSRKSAEPSRKSAAALNFALEGWDRRFLAIEHTETWVAPENTHLDVVSHRIEIRVHPVVIPNPGVLSDLIVM